MEKTIKYALEAIESACEMFHEKDDTVAFVRENEKNFSEEFKKNYAHIMNQYMKDTKELDSHKQAAIIVISAMKSGLVTAGYPDDKITLAPELILVKVALSYMNDILNQKLKQSSRFKINKFSLPLPLSCDTPYIEVMCRLLYYEQIGKEHFNILELSDRFFLLEYINLLQNGIEPSLLKEEE